MSMASRTMSFCPSILRGSNENFSRLLQRALNDLRAAGFRKATFRLMRSVDMRYRYQVHELNVPFPAGTRNHDRIGYGELSPHCSTTCMKKRLAKARATAKRERRY